ncbi:MAG TPA: fumarate hydratase [bacterium]|nr:fumarate hydratase [bacterium]
MRKVKAQAVEEAVRRACIEANLVGSKDLVEAFQRAREIEESETGRAVLDQLLENLRIAEREKIPICQDTGYAVFFVERGEELMIEGGTLDEAINAGMMRGYTDGYLRKGTCDCLTRKNRGDNSPAVIYTECIPGDGLKISFMAKGGGSENMSGVAMLKPAQGWKGIREFVVGTVDKAGANPCPPIIIGLGIGGTMDKAAVNAKKALLRPLGEKNPDPELAAMEAELLEAVNKLGIGPQGYGGRVTALGVSIIRWPCHIASLPVAINVQCHASRHREIEL